MRSWACARLKLARPLTAAASCDRAPVEAERELGLAHVLEADREVVGVVGIGRLEVMGLEIGLLRRRPLRLVGVQVAQREVKVGRGLARDQLLQPRFGGERVGATEQCDQPALRQRVARIELQDLQVAPRRLLALALPRRDRRQPEQRVDALRLGAEQLARRGAAPGRAVRIAARRRPRGSSGLRTGSALPAADRRSRVAATPASSGAAAAPAAQAAASCDAAAAADSAAASFSKATARAAARPGAGAAGAWASGGSRPFAGRERRPVRRTARDERSAGRRKRRSPTANRPAIVPSTRADARARTLPLLRLAGRLAAAACIDGAGLRLRPALCAGAAAAAGRGAAVRRRAADGPLRRADAVRARARLGGRSGRGGRLQLQPRRARRALRPGPWRPFPRPSSTGSSRGAGLLGLLRCGLRFRQEALEEL